MSTDDPRRGAEWHEARHAAVTRDGSTCQNCGVDVGPRYDPTVTEWAVHHIVPLEDAGTNDPENLEALCRPCHTRKHRGTLHSRTEADR